MKDIVASSTVTSSGGAREMLEFPPRPRVQARSEFRHDAGSPCFASQCPVFSTRSSLRLVLGAVLFLCFLVQVSGIARASGPQVRGTVLATARVLSVPSASAIASAEREWFQLTPQLLAERRREVLARGIPENRETGWLRAFVKRCNREQMATGDHAHFELVTLPGENAPILQLEWIGN